MVRIEIDLISPAVINYVYVLKEAKYINCI